MGKPSGGAFVGLDIGTQTIKVVEVRGAGNGLQITALGMENTPPGAIQSGVIMDSKALGTAIKSLLGKAGVRAKKAVVAAAGAQSVVVRVIEVPKMTPAELAETMKWEVERHIPFAANDVEMGYQAIDDPQAAADPNNPNMEVLLAVAQRDMVASHLQTLQLAGLSPAAIDVEPLSAGRALIDLDRVQGRQNKNVVVVNIGASNTDVGIFKSGVLRFPRTVPLAGDNFTRAIADHLGLSMDQAEDEKRENATILMDLVNAAPSDDPFGGGFGGGGAAAGAGPSPFDFSDVPMNTPFAQPLNQPAAPANPFETPTSAPANPFEEAPTMVSGAPAPPPAGDDGERPTLVPGSPGAPANPFAENPFAQNPFSDNPFATESPTQGTMPGGAAGAAGGATPAVPAPDDPRSQRRREIFEALLPVLQEFSMEIRRSVDYFRSRYPTETIDQVVLCGGSARIPNLDQFLQSDLGVPTVVADPFAGINVTARQVSPEYRQQIAPAFAVALGLAARDAVLGPDK